MAAETEAVPSATPPCSSPGRDPRVRCRSRRWTAELMGHCKSYMRALGDEQPVEAETLKWALSEAVWNFETAVQENMTINGKPWQESSDDLQNGADIKLLEDQLDELIVEVASKRNQRPRKIQAHVVKGIKAQQEILGFYQPVVKPQEIKATPSQDSQMANLRLSAEAASKHIGNSFKSMTSLLGKAEGFSTALSLQPTLELCKIRQEVFSSSEVKAENQTKGKNLMEQVEVRSPGTTTSNSVILKIKRPSCSPQKMYPLRQRKIGLDT
ncbi:PREDICTED: kinetochore-associated protein NSL1 homolog [Gekko japonicus]|uniref:Kinetochore-associated protein NSL1 homolog n=1 Tax=Gekko japonicus TaxID=146911 RepID=A0ABM1LAV2_GEKJA|nr:PREDICTED: kinetochore-associated protein NSL1 homolog [Gekko japonicus]